MAAPNDLFTRRLGAIADEGGSCDLVLNPSVGDLRSKGSWRALGDYYLENDLLKHHGLAVLSNADADHAAMSSMRPHHRPGSGQHASDHSTTGLQP